VKDIGTAQLTSMLSLAFALLRSYTTLNFWQLMVAVMSLEVTSATVQMALSQKETLASRWWVVLNSASQLLVQASLAIVVGVSFPMSSVQQDPCQPCVRAVWWGTFDSCKKVPRMFWIYWTIRTLTAVRSCAIGLHHMHFYDFSERIAKGEKPTKKISWSTRQNHQNLELGSVFQNACDHVDRLDSVDIACWCGYLEHGTHAVTL
ncbi:hypothetical protein KCU86_g21710, partial [Aureobasidium melanogenum]